MRFEYSTAVPSDSPEGEVYGLGLSGGGGCVVCESPVHGRRTASAKCWIEPTLRAIQKALRKEET